MSELVEVTESISGSTESLSSTVIKSLNIGLLVLIFIEFEDDVRSKTRISIHTRRGGGLILQFNLFHTFPAGEVQTLRDHSNSGVVSREHDPLEVSSRSGNIVVEVSQ